MRQTKETERRGEKRGNKRREKRRRLRGVTYSGERVPSVDTAEGG